MSERRAPGWGSFHSQPSPPHPADDPPGARKISDSGSMLRKSRLGKEKKPLVCQACQEPDAEGVEQLPACNHVLCKKCSEGADFTGCILD